MKFKLTLIGLSLCTLVTACGSSSTKDSSITPIEHSSIALKLPEEGVAMVEDYPLASYITYPANERVIDGISSIDANWPSLDIFQTGKEFGYVDGQSEEQFYYAVEHKSNDALMSVDAERQAQKIWYVSGDNQLNLYNRETEQDTRWEINKNAEFTEIAIDEEGQNNIWLYDQAAHQLVHFNADSEQATTLPLQGDLHVTGLAIVDDNFLILANNNTEHFVMLYAVEEISLVHQKSWLLEGFTTQFFNDITLLPNGEVAVSTTGTESNLYLLADRDELLGNGPIEHVAELELLEQVVLNESIKQPSGLWSLSDGSWMFITDQAEMFKLDSEFNIIEKSDIDFDSINCNQGCTEAIVGGEDEFYALADNGLIGHFVKSGSDYIINQEFNIVVADDDGNPYTYSGLGHDIATGEFYLVSDQSGEHQEDKLIILNGDLSVKAVHSITYAGESDNSIHTYDAQGVQFYDGNIFVLSEKFTKILQLNLSGEIMAVIDLSEQDVRLPSDFVIKDGLFYIIGDHEDHEPVPPISIFEVDD